MMWQAQAAWAIAIPPSVAIAVVIGLSACAAVAGAVAWNRRQP